MGYDADGKWDYTPKSGKISTEFGNSFEAVADPLESNNAFTNAGYGEGMSEAAAKAFESGNTVASIDPASSSMFDGAFSADNIGGTMQGIGSIATAAAGMYDAYNKKKYQDKVFGMEEKRVERETKRQDKQQAAYDKVFG